MRVLANKFGEIVEVESAEWEQDQAPSPHHAPTDQAITFLRSMAATNTTLTDTQALSMPDILPTWQEFLDSGREIPSGVCLTHEHQCYRQAQSAPIKPEAQRPPGSPGMSAVYRPIVSGHAGTLDDPIPWVYEMDCKEGKYY